MYIIHIVHICLAIGIATLPLPGEEDCEALRDLAALEVPLHVLRKGPQLPGHTGPSFERCMKPI